MKYTWLIGVSLSSLSVSTARAQGCYGQQVGVAAAVARTDRLDVSLSRAADGLEVRVDGEITIPGDPPLYYEAQDLRLRAGDSAILDGGAGRRLTVKTALLTDEANGSPSCVRVRLVTGNGCALSHAVHREIDACLP